METQRGGISPVLLIGKEVFLMLNTIGFLGCGNMGGAVARAVCKAADPQNVWLANRTAAKARRRSGPLSWAATPPSTTRWQAAATSSS